MSSLKEIYIILTRYQLLITLLKLKKEENNVLILLDDILKPDKAEEMISSGLVQEIIRLNDYDFTITRDFCSTSDIRKKTLKLLKNAKDIRKVYFFERKGKKYKSKNLIMTFDPAIIFYPSGLIKEKLE